MRLRTTRPFGINLFAPLPPSESSKNPETMLARLAPYFAELDLPAPSLPKSPASSFDEQLAAALESGVIFQLYIRNSARERRPSD